MEALTSTQFESMIDGAEVLSRDDFGDNVFRASDGTILKLFRPWSMLSSSRLQPYASRFTRAARELARRDVPTVEVVNQYAIPQLRRHVIGYRELSGDSLRTLLDDETTFERLMNRLAGFCAELHSKGIYFRGLHLDNIIVGDDGAFGLIDLTGARFSRHPLGPFRRARNFRPMVREDPDRSAIRHYGPARFMADYLEAARLSDSARRIFLNRLRRVDELFRDLGSGERGPDGQGGP